MYITNIPALLCALCVTTYWLTVFIKAVLITPQIGKAPNIIPREALGLLSRLVMVPLIVCWIFLPWQSALYASPTYPHVALAGAFCCLIALSLSFYCWYYMGNAWRIGIDPGEKNRLITDGPFKRIRHPIYALSMLLMLGSFMSVQTQPLFILFCVHWILFSLEAYREERYLSKIHGASWQEYVKQSSRFLPLNICK